MNEKEKSAHGAATPLGNSITQIVRKVKSEN